MKLDILLGALMVEIVVVNSWIPPQPKNNVWVTLANITGQDTLCLSLSTPGNPFSTCLVGVPLDFFPCNGHLQGLPPCKSAKQYADSWDLIAPNWPITSVEPQELELLGSLKADWCIYFNWTSKDRDPTKAVNVNSAIPVYRNATAWCNYTSPNISRSTNIPVKLPEGVFLICGDRAWAGIPSKLEGGPCSLGRLTLLTPNTSMIMEAYRNHARNGRKKHSLHAFAADCNDKMKFWSPIQMFFASIFHPGIAGAKALKLLDQLGCWLSKQNNATSIALSGLLTDVDSIRHATLQNRAAIDFLLLAHGHGCDDFEGMCCMNLSDHSRSIHTQLLTLQRLTSHLQQETGLGLFGWLKNLGLGPWLREIVYSALIILAFILILLAVLPCIMNCIQRMISRLLNQAFQANLVSLKENGGDVESFVDAWLAEKGHDKVQLVRQ